MNKELFLLGVKAHQIKQIMNDVEVIKQILMEDGYSLTSEEVFKFYAFIKIMGQLEYLTPVE